MIASQPSDSSSVRIEIEEDGKLHTFELPKEKLCSMSIFFRVAFQGNFLEAVTGIMHISDISADLFGAFANWIESDQLGPYTLEELLDLYILADMFDVPTLRRAITDRLTSYCFAFGFQVPDRSLIDLVMENIPKSSPLHDLLAIAVARLLWHKPEGLDPLPYGFAVRVKKQLDKPYGLCDKCYDLCDTSDQIQDNCDHFFEEPSDFDPRRYIETTGIQ